MYIPINFAAVLVGTIIYMIVGSLWYSPMLFAKPWMKLVGKTAKDIKKQSMTKTYGTTFLMEFIASYVMANVIFYTNPVTFIEGALTGLFIWVGFTATTAITTYLFEGKPMKLFAINYGYHLLAFMLLGTLHSVWR